MFGIIYKITNKINGKSYIGQTVQDISKRWKQHCNSKTCRLLHNSIKKYGRENFLLEIVGTFPQERLNLEEIDTIKKYNTIVPNGYNLSFGGEGGGIPSKETRKRMSERWKGDKNPNFKRVFSEEERRRISERMTGENSHRFGKRISDWHKQRISETNTGKKRTEEFKKNVSERMKGQTFNRGKKRSLETKLMISKAKTGVGNHNFGKHFSEEHKKKLSEGVSKTKLRKKLIRILLSRISATS